ncbi:hypothetical protein C6A88_02285, partial [Mycolicibacterium austroafricanum]
MADLDELYGEIPTRQIAARLGADEHGQQGLDRAAHLRLVGGLQQNALDPGTASTIASAANSHAGLLDGGVDVDQVDEVD